MRGMVSLATSDTQGYTGMGVHHAARIGAAAQGGEVLVSQAVLDAVSDERATKQMRELELKGISGLTKVFALVY